MKTLPAFLTALLFLSLCPLSTKASESPFQGTLRILEESRGEGTLLVEGEVKGPPGGKLFPKALVLSPAPSPEEEELPGFQVELLEPLVWVLEIFWILFISWLPLKHYF